MNDEVAGLGHNQPPEVTPIEKIKERYKDLFVRLDALKAEFYDLPKEIASEADAEKVGDWMKMARVAIKSADEARKIEYEPFKRLVDHVNAIFNRPKDEVKKIRDDVQERLDKFLTAKAAREKAEREEKARREREEAERAAREAAEAERRRLEEQRQAEEARQRAEEAQRQREEAERRAREERERAEQARRERIEAEKRWKEEEAKRAEAEALRKQQQALREQEEAEQAERRAAEEAKARAEQEHRDREHRAKMEALRKAEEEAEARRREERERAEAALEERRKAEDEEREANRGAREAKRDENMNMTMAERADRLAQKHERAASDETGNSRTRSELGSLSSLQKRWQVDIIDERKLPKDVLWDYIPLEAKKAAVWKWMVNQPNDEKFRQMEGASIQRVTTAQVR
jgi:hypothetical protein